MNLRRTLMKLTLGYLVLIMLVSAAFSIVLYRVGTRPLERRLDLRERVTHEEMMPPPPEAPQEMEFFRKLDELAVSEVKRHFAISLVYFNIGVFCLAGLLSYGLAKRELKPLEAAIDLQNRFTSDAAHELRTPLTAMKAEIEVALRGGDLKTGEIHELLESNLEEIGKLEALSSSLLKLAQYEEDSGRAGFGGVELSSVAEEAVERIKRSAEVRGIEINLSLEELAVFGDRTYLIEMLVILLDNSIKYSDDGTTITVATRRQKRCALLTVTDEGYGIEESDVPHVFDRFYRGQVPVSKKQASGYGLGLSIAKRIAEIHRGSIEIQSEPQKGTTATIKLPLAGKIARLSGSARKT